MKKSIFLVLLLFSDYVNSCDFSIDNPPKFEVPLLKFITDNEVEKKAYIASIDYLVLKKLNPKEYFTSGSTLDVSSGILKITLEHYSGFCVNNVLGNPSGKDGMISYDVKNQKVLSFSLWQ